jgi:hypothetical protein
MYVCIKVEQIRGKVRGDLGAQQYYIYMMCVYIKVEQVRAKVRGDLGDRYERGLDVRVGKNKGGAVWDPSPDLLRLFGKQVYITSLHRTERERERSTSLYLNIYVRISFCGMPPPTHGQCGRSIHIHQAYISIYRHMRIYMPYCP